MDESPFNENYVNFLCRLSLSPFSWESTESGGKRDFVACRSLFRRIITRNEAGLVPAVLFMMLCNKTNGR